MNNNRFEGKVCIVTGAAQGIGEGVARAIAKEGGMMVLADRSELVYQVANELESNGSQVLVVTSDLESFGGAKSVVDKAVEHFGRVDVAIHNVGGTIWAKPFEQYQEDEIIKEINRSLYPTLWGCRAVLPQMISQGGGSIVNISSIATRGVNRIPYSAAKGGVNAITVSLAMEHASENIRVNAIATGGTEAPPRKIPRNSNPMTEDEKVWYQQIVDQTIDSTLMKRYGTIEEQVNAILFLASDEASYITGTILPVGGGDKGMGA
ncbi:1,6-dihydroxycyclohexa-2,4-diene-1-carboxylate dehydrogenase [Psychrobacter piechaudii]|uniref:Glucose 1-dehydrogenase 2 n=1 Tax=Psychrobacter piechaudii TaxID=1945521 RepID=A0A1R4GYX5_9GAMM|nr:1,6-dihydroxycyclohexa-2,4-diene-1-carboxylate dehydrogenase [Psychrobacter piechaudii]SJM73002.1 Glucose 1-dehydrogenase 2 [Psychrobacter piechaudii]